MTEKIGHSVAISFASIQKIAVGYDVHPCASEPRSLFYLFNKPTNHQTFVSIL